MKANPTPCDWLSRVFRKTSMLMSSVFLVQQHSRLSGCPSCAGTIHYTCSLTPMMLVGLYPIAWLNSSLACAACFYRVEKTSAVSFSGIQRRISADYMKLLRCTFHQSDSLSDVSRFNGTAQRQMSIGDLSSELSLNPELNSDVLGGTSSKGSVPSTTNVVRLFP